MAAGAARGLRTVIRSRPRPGAGGSRRGFGPDDESDCPAAAWEVRE